MDKQDNIPFIQSGFLGHVQQRGSGKLQPVPRFGTGDELYLPPGLSIFAHKDYSLRNTNCYPILISTSANIYTFIDVSQNLQVNLQGNNKRSKKFIDANTPFARRIFVCEFGRQLQR